MDTLTSDSLTSILGRLDGRLDVFGAEKVGNLSDSSQSVGGSPRNHPLGETRYARADILQPWPTTADDESSVLLNRPDVSDRILSPESGNQPFETAIITSGPEPQDPLLGTTSNQALVTPSTELITNNNLLTRQSSFTHFSLFDASGDSTANTVLNDGALRLNYGWNGNNTSRLDVHLEAWQSDRRVFTLGAWDENFILNGLVNLADVNNLTAGDYNFRLVANSANGTSVASDFQSISIVPWVFTEGSFQADTLAYGGSTTPSSVTHSIVVGRGGTDTLALNDVSVRDVANINGVDLADFSNTNTNTNQALFGGTAFDYLTLTDGREIYLQGIEVLNFADGRLNLMVQPNDTYFGRQWNLHVSDVPGAWRFTQGTNNVLLVSLDSGVLLTPNPRTASVDVESSRLLLDVTDDDDNRTDNGHGQQAVSVMASAANNGYGITGINWHSPVDVHDLYSPDDRVSLQQAIATTLAYARRNNLRVVFQGGIQGEYWLNDGGTRTQLEQLIRDNADIAVFAIAAGNGNVDIDETNPWHPSVRSGESGGVARLQTNHGNVIAVGALENRHQNGFWANTWQYGLMNAGNVRRANYSNYGQSLTLVAATDSPAIDRFGELNFFNGTSAANPNMAGIASLVWSVNTALNGEEIRQILIDTAMDLGNPGRDNAFGHGLVNAEAAVRRAWALSRNQDLANLYQGDAILA